MPRYLLLVLIMTVLTISPARAAQQYAQVIVADPYLEMRTGPGRGYPVFHVVDRGDGVEIVKRRTDWFKVRTDRGREGWVHQDEMELTLRPSGEQAEFAEADFGAYAGRRWEAGAMGGDFGGANVLGAYGAYSFTPNLSAELWASKILGTFSDGLLVSANVVHQFFPEWRASPFFTLGTGVIHIEPKATLVQTEDRTDQAAHVGLGVRLWMARRFVFRAEYKSYVVFTSRDENEEIEEWKAGFAFFF